MATALEQGLIHLSSPYSVPETLAPLEGIVRAKGLKIHARINHSDDAAQVGLEMRPAELLVFGSPKTGKPLKVASPKAAIDLPLKALAWQDADGKAWLSYNSPEYLAERYSIPSDLLQNIAGIRALFEEAVIRP